MKRRLVSSLDGVAERVLPVRVEREEVPVHVGDAEQVEALREERVELGDPLPQLRLGAEPADGDGGLVHERLDRVVIRDPAALLGGDQ